MNISLFGLGYVGCVSLGCLAQAGHSLIGVDLIDSKIDMINSGKPTIIEKDIKNIIYSNWKKGRICATNDYIDAVRKTDISIICVGTPSTKEGHLNLNYIYNTAKQIGQGLRIKGNFHVIVIRSTVPPGTNEKVGLIIEKASGKKRNEGFAVVSNPEFLREGTAVEDYYNPPFTILASDSTKALHLVKEIYKNINTPIEETEINVAEVIKYVNNSFHALKITFANEVGNICKKLQIDSHKVMDLFCRDKKLNLSSYYFKPGFAYGGSCLPKDLKAFRILAYDLYLKTPVLESIENSNEIQKQIAFDMIENTGKKKIGILGLSFKKGTDDLRYSPIVEIAEILLGKGYKMLIYDEKVSLSKITGTNKDFIEQRIPHLSKILTDDFNFVVSKSDVLVITHNERKFSMLNKKFPKKKIIDLARITDKQSHVNYNGICW